MVGVRSVRPFAWSGKHCLAVRGGKAVVDSPDAVRGTPMRPARGFAMDGEDTGRTIPRRGLLRGAARGAAAIVTASAFGPTVSLLGRRAAAQEATQVRLTGAPSSPEESRLLEQVLQDFAGEVPRHHGRVGAGHPAVRREAADRFGRRDSRRRLLRRQSPLPGPRRPWRAAAARRAHGRGRSHGRRLLRRPDRGIPMAGQDLRPAEGLVEPRHGLRPAGV